MITHLSKSAVPWPSPRGLPRIARVAGGRHRRSGAERHAPMDSNRAGRACGESGIFSTVPHTGIMRTRKRTRTGGPPGLGRPGDDSARATTTSGPLWAGRRLGWPAGDSDDPRGPRSHPVTVTPAVSARAGPGLPGTNDSDGHNWLTRRQWPHEQRGGHCCMAPWPSRLAEAAST